MLAQRVRRHDRVHLHRRRLRGRAPSRSCASWQQADPRVRILRQPAPLRPRSRSTSGSRTRHGRVHRPHGRAHALPRRTTSRAGVERLRRGGADHVSGPQLPQGAGTWSRRVALALGTPLGTRRGAVPPRSPSGEIEVDSGFTGVWPRATLERTAAGTRTGPTTRTPSWRRASAAAAAAWCACPRWRAQLHPARQPDARWRASTGATASTGPRPPARHPESMRRSHLLAPSVALSLAAARAAARRRAPLRARGRRALVRRGRGRRDGGAWRADSALESTRRQPTWPRCPPVFVAMHLAWGLRLPVRLRRASARRSRPWRTWPDEPRA